MNWIKWLGEFFHPKHESVETVKNKDLVPTECELDSQLSQNDRAKDSEILQMEDLIQVEELNDDILCDYVVILTPSDEDLCSNNDVETIAARNNSVPDAGEHSSADVLQPRESIDKVSAQQESISQILETQESRAEISKPQESPIDIPERDTISAQVLDSQELNAKVSKMPESRAEVPDLQELCTKAFQSKELSTDNSMPNESDPEVIEPRVSIIEKYECDQVSELHKKYEESFVLWLNVIADGKKDALLSPTLEFEDNPEGQSSSSKILNSQELNTGISESHKSTEISEAELSRLQDFGHETFELIEKDEHFSKYRVLCPDMNKWNEMKEKSKKFGEQCKEVFGPMIDEDPPLSDDESKMELLDHFLSNLAPMEDAEDLIDPKKYRMPPSLESPHFINTLKRRKGQFSHHYRRPEEFFSENTNAPRTQPSGSTHKPQHLNKLRRSNRIYKGLSVLSSF